MPALTRRAALTGAAALPAMAALPAAVPISPPVTDMAPWSWYRAYCLTENAETQGFPLVQELMGILEGAVAHGNDDLMLHNAGLLVSGALHRWIETLDVSPTPPN